LGPPRESRSPKTEHIICSLRQPAPDHQHKPRPISPCTYNYPSIKWPRLRSHARNSRGVRNHQLPTPNDAQPQIKTQRTSRFHATIINAPFVGSDRTPWLLFIVLFKKQAAVHVANTLWNGRRMVQPKAHWRGNFCDEGNEKSGGLPQ